MSTYQDQPKDLTPRYNQTLEQLVGYRCAFVSLFRCRQDTIKYSAYIMDQEIIWCGWVRDVWYPEILSDYLPEVAKSVGLNSAQYKEISSISWSLPNDPRLFYKDLPLDSDPYLPPKILDALFDKPFVPLEVEEEAP